MMGARETAEALRAAADAAEAGDALKAGDRIETARMVYRAWLLGEANRAAREAGSTGRAA